MDGTMRRGHKTQLNGTHLEKREGREDDGNIEVMSCERIGDESQRGRENRDGERERDATETSVCEGRRKVIWGYILG